MPDPQKHNVGLNCRGIKDAACFRSCNKAGGLQTLHRPSKCRHHPCNSTHTLNHILTCGGQLKELTFLWGRILCYNKVMSFISTVTSSNSAKKPNKKQTLADPALTAGQQAWQPQPLPLKHGCRDPALQGHNPAGFSVLPGRRQASWD